MCPKFAYFFLGIQLIFTILLFQHFWKLYVITRIQIIHHLLIYVLFLFTVPLSCKHFNPLDVECLWLESLVLASSHTNIKLAWKMATHLVCVMTKHCSDLTLSHIDKQYLFLQQHAAIFVSALGGKTDQPGHLPPQIQIESNSSFNLCPVFHLKFYLCHTEHFRMMLDGSMVSAVYRQHMPVCAKMISWERKFLGLAKVTCLW